MSRSTAAWLTAVAAVAWGGTWIPSIAVPANAPYAQNEILVNDSLKGIAACGNGKDQVPFHGTTDVDAMKRICELARAVAEACKTGACQVHDIEAIRKADPKLLRLLQRGRVRSVRVQWGQYRRRIEAYVDFGKVAQQWVELRLISDAGRQWRADEWEIAVE